MIFTVPLKVTTTGGAGVATGSAASPFPVRGYVMGVFLNFHASAPATTDTTLRTKGNSAPSRNLLVVTNSATDAFIATADKPVDNANVAITNAHRGQVVDDYLEIALAQCDALTDAVVAHVLVDDGK